MSGIGQKRDRAQRGAREKVGDNDEEEFGVEADVCATAGGK